MQPRAGTQASSVQTLWSSQSTGAAPLQEPLWHDSPTVQLFPSSQAPPSGIAVYTHPRAGSHPSVVQGLASWHWSAGAELCWQPAPGEQKSAVQASWSSQLSGVPEQK